MTWGRDASSMTRSNSNWKSYAASGGPNLEILDRQIEAAQLLLVWLSQALEPQSPTFPVVQMPPPSSSPADRDQTLTSAPEPPTPCR
jgi:hypothetical protein